MKNGLMIWNVVLTLVAGYLLIAHFTSKKNTLPVRTSSNDSVNIHSRFRIAYFEMDSVENNSLMVKDAQSEINKREKEYNNDVASLDQTYNNRLENYKQRAGTMTKEDYEKARFDLQQLENQLSGQKQQLYQDYQDFIMRRQLSLKTTIADFLKDYNKTKNYTYIIVYAGDLIYSKDTTYDITADVVSGLNEMYKNKKK